MISEEDIKYFRKFLSLAKKGKVRLLTASLKNMKREVEAGHNCYLVVITDLVSDIQETEEK